MTGPRLRYIVRGLTALAALLGWGVAHAHGIAGDDQAFLLRATGPPRTCARTASELPARCPAREPTRPRTRSSGQARANGELTEWRSRGAGD